MILDGYAGDDECGRPTWVCWDCGGDGWVEQATSDDEYDNEMVRCPTCSGAGIVRGNGEMAVTDGGEEKGNDDG